MDRAEKKRWIWPWGSLCLRGWGLCLRGWASHTLGQSFNGLKLRGWASHTLWQSFNSFNGFKGFRGAGKRQAWTPIRSLRSHCCGLGVPVGVDRAEKKRWIWPWGSLCLRGWASHTLGQNGLKLRGWASHTLWQSFNGFKGFKGFNGFKGWQAALGVPVGMDRCWEETMDLALTVAYACAVRASHTGQFKRLASCAGLDVPYAVASLNGFKAIVVALGCLLAWTALRRNDGSGLGVAYACAAGHPRRLDIPDAWTEF